MTINKSLWHAANGNGVNGGMVNGNGLHVSQEKANLHVEDKLESLPPKTMPIAIVGMSCRFPGGATDPSKLWDLCVNGRSAWSEIPENRFVRDAWYHPDKEHIGTVGRSSVFNKET